MVWPGTEGLEGDGAVHSDAGMASFRIGPALYPLEGGVGKFVSCLPFFRVEQSSCILPQKDSIMALSYKSPTVPMEASSPAARKRWPKAHKVYCEPWAECSIVRCG